MSEFVSLTKALWGYFDKPLAELPEAVRQHAGMRLPGSGQRDNRAFVLIPWDSILPDQRRCVALQWDCNNDPANEQERRRAWNLQVKCSDLEREIAEVQAAGPMEISLVEKRDLLSQLQRDLASANQELAQVVGDAVAEPVYSSGAPGRPTSMGFVLEEFSRRCEEKTLADTVTKEADSLKSWLDITHEKAPPLTSKTIKNKISAKFRTAKAKC
jgi:hypothetical protein